MYRDDDAHKEDDEDVSHFCARHSSFDLTRPLQLLSPLNAASAKVLAKEIAVQLGKFFSQNGSPYPPPPPIQPEVIIQPATGRKANPIRPEAQKYGQVRNIPNFPRMRTDFLA